MPPKKSISRDQIIDKAFEIVRTKGSEYLTARNLAKALECSTQPIYNEFNDMIDLKTTLSQRAFEIMKQYIINNSKEYHDPILSKVLGYVQFANEESYLFQLMYTGQNGLEVRKEASSQIKSELELNLIVYAHGIVMMKAFGTLELSWAQIREMIVNAFYSFGGESDENRNQ